VVSDRSDRHSFAFEHAVFARRDEKMNMMTTGETQPLDEIKIIYSEWEGDRRLFV
jgi:hypothetical protein